MPDLIISRDSTNPALSQRLGCTTSGPVIPGPLTPAVPHLVQSCLACLGDGIDAATRNLLVVTPHLALAVLADTVAAFVSREAYCQLKVYSPVAGVFADISCESWTTNGGDLHGIFESTLDSLTYSVTAIVGIMGVAGRG